MAFKYLRESSNHSYKKQTSMFGIFPLVIVYTTNCLILSYITHLVESSFLAFILFLPKLTSSDAIVTFYVNYKISLPTFSLAIANSLLFHCIYVKRQLLFTERESILSEQFKCFMKYAPVSYLASICVSNTDIPVCII